MRNGRWADWSYVARLKRGRLAWNRRRIDYRLLGSGFYCFLPGVCRLTGWRTCWNTKLPICMIGKLASRSLPTARPLLFLICQGCVRRKKQHTTPCWRAPRCLREECNHTSCNTISLLPSWLLSVTWFLHGSTFRTIFCRPQAMPPGAEHLACRLLHLSGE